MSKESLKLTESTPVKVAAATFVAIVVGVSLGYARFTAVEAQTHSNSQDIQSIDEKIDEILTRQTEQELNFVEIKTLLFGIEKDLEELKNNR